MDGYAEIKRRHIYIYRDIVSVVDLFRFFKTEIVLLVIFKKKTLDVVG